MTVPYQLACPFTGAGKSQSHHDSIQTCLQKEQQGFSGHPFLTCCFDKITMKLSLSKTVNPFNFLFLAKLHSEFGTFSSTALTMLSWSKWATFNRTFIRKTTVAL